MDLLLERTSERLLRNEDNVTNNLFNEKKWEWPFLRRKCYNLELEPFFETYVQRLRVSHLSLFLSILILVLLVHVIILLSTTDQKENIYMDIGVYFVSCVIICITLAFDFNSELVQRHPWVMYLTSWIAVTVLVVADVGVTVFHEYANHNSLRPAYAAFLVYSVYIFMPLPKDVHAVLLGLAVTMSYLIDYTYVTYRVHAPKQETFDWQLLVSEAIFLFCANLLGLFTRLTREVAIRTTFLDRRQCVEETLLLRYARDQEKGLLLSIIPARIANRIEKDVKMRIENLKKTPNDRKITTEAGISPDKSMPIVKRWRHPDNERLFIEPHDDVSILYADLVNYTHLTTRLDVKTLVETLHDLFVRFDNASQRFNVLRIKFLGDCYYCVSGVPIPNEHHAKCCVDLGLRMIKDIRDVRTKRKLDIDMRIGVHSGSILSGVIGACKWQYDIWSKDVDIASRLESTGVAGRVHVSEQTLRLLDGEYLYEEGTQKATKDEVLQKYKIRSFLIKPPRTMSAALDLHWKPQNARASEAVENRSDYIASSFMQNTIIQYNQIRAQATLEMSREMDKMPINRIQLTRYIFSRSKRLTQDEMEEQTFRSNITSILLFFKDWRWEMLYMSEPDTLFKYSVLFGLLTFLAIIAMQAVNKGQTVVFWASSGIELFVLGIIIVLAWYRKIWMMWYSEGDVVLPANRASLILFNLSGKVQTNIYIRVLMYLFLIGIQLAAAFMQMGHCDDFKTETEQFFKYDNFMTLCFSPWAVTNSLLLIICMIFIFTRIPFVLKLSLGFIIVFTYALVITLEFAYIYESSIGTNEGLTAEYSHIMILIITLIVFLVMDRQTEFISKVDYTWKRQLQKKQDDAKVTNETIKVLINNILPSHVADIYMTKQMRNELYYEEYENVAVMFASVRNYDTEKVGLRVLNEIICDFDEVLNSYKGALKIEKIKVAGWTYMAACGLDVERSGSVVMQPMFRNSSLLPNGRRSQHDITHNNNGVLTRGSHFNKFGVSSDPSGSSAGDRTNNNRISSSRYEGHQKTASRKISNQQQNNVVYVMVQLALDLMRTMRAFNEENLQINVGSQDRGSLRVGISHGEIMAGVVGSYKPHYDIWGNAVNMASRMESTGQPDSIQVTQNTAEILKSFGIQCHYRGMTFVKGRGNIPTYFVAIDDNLEFIRNNSATAIAATTTATLPGATMSTLSLPTLALSTSTAQQPQQQSEQQQQLQQQQETIQSSKT